MKILIDLINKRFGRLIVVKRMDNDKYGRLRWLCQCDCGVQKIIIGNSIKSGSTKSCGCLRKEISIKYNTKHGHYRKGRESQIHRIWNGIIQRCTNSNDKDYYNYGGRSIKVCKRWMKFDNFFEDMGKPPTNKHSIDRIDNNGNYCKSNCRWATSKQQAQNRRDNNLKTFNRKTQCLAVWAKEMDIPESTLRNRLNRGLSIEQALITL